MEKKDTFNAKLAFILSLFSWVPLLNVGICVASIIISIKTISQIIKDKKRYGGYWYAIAALVISSSVLLVTIIFLIVYAQRKLTCEVVNTSDLF